MKPHPRIRKTIKWGGAAVTVLLVVVWVGSGWWEGGYSGSRVQRLIIGRGQIGLILTSVPLPPHHGWGCQRVTDREGDVFSWWWASESDPDYTMVRLPIWLAILAIGGASTVAWRLDTLARRRERVGFCPKCGYDRTGLVGVGGAAGAVCPECGAGAPSKV